MTTNNTALRTAPHTAFCGIDILRLLLCAAVVFYHYVYPRPSCGPVAVIGFFVLSGFLCAYGLSRRGFDNRAFYRNKARRLLPTLLTSTVFAVAALGYRTATSPDLSLLSLWETWQHAEFSLYGLIEIINIPTWYMQGEILCLILVPMLGEAMGKKSVFAGLFLIFFSVTVIQFAQIPWAAPFGNGLYFSPLCRVWQFMLGMACYGLMRLKIPVVAGGTIIALFAMLYIASTVLLQDKDLHFINYTLPFDILVALLYALLIPALAKVKCTTLSPMLCRKLSYAATLTYGIYLFHVPVFLLFRHIHPNGWLISYEADYCSIFLVILIAAADQKLWHKLLSGKKKKQVKHPITRAE